MGVWLPCRWSENKEQALTKQQNTHPILLILPLNPMPSATQSEATNFTQPEADSARRRHLVSADTQCDKEPQKTIDMFTIYDIDLL